MQQRRAFGLNLSDSLKRRFTPLWHGPIDCENDNARTYRPSPSQVSAACQRKDSKMSNPFVVITTFFLSLVAADHLATEGEFTSKIMSEVNEKL